MKQFWEVCVYWQFSKIGSQIHMHNFLDLHLLFFVTCIILFTSSFLAAPGIRPFNCIIMWLQLLFVLGFVFFMFLHEYKESTWVAQPSKGMKLCFDADFICKQYVSVNQRFFQIYTLFGHVFKRLLHQVQEPITSKTWYASLWYIGLSEKSRMLEYSI